MSNGSFVVFAQGINGHHSGLECDKNEYASLSTWPAK